MTILPPLPQRGQKALDHRHLADDVDLQLTTQLLEREKLERRGDGDPGVVHKPSEPGVARSSRAAAIDSESVESSVTVRSPAERSRSASCGLRAAPTASKPSSFRWWAVASADAG